ncbi:hypothetical protein JOF53_000724 [Crossiella equi]|uniref:AAA+ ATPase domain-containing protein n=1 Tax=Crossiella equi TaxID=130796 RepID=A0ABS5A6H3_9PSEU|nr:hypothetical protein [Crossiella equi]
MSARAIGDLERGKVARPHARSVVALGTALGGSALAELRAAALPPLPEMPAPRQLPAGEQIFVGRRAELRELLDLMCRRTVGPAVVLVTGAPGSGKTALAVRACQLLAQRYPDGQLYVDLRGGQSPEEATARVLRSLGVPAATLPSEAAGRTALLRSLLHPRRLVLLLDGVTEERQVRALLPGNSGSAVIVSSCEALPGLGVTGRLVLGPLDPGAGQALFRLALGAEAVARQEQAVAELVRLCDGHPLALRILVNQLLSRPHWSPADLADRLRDPAGRLDHLVAGDLSVRASLARAHRRLSPVAVDLLDALAGTAEALAEEDLRCLLGWSPSVTRAAVDELADANLLLAAGPRRWVLPALVRLFVRETAGSCHEVPGAEHPRDQFGLVADPQLVPDPLDVGVHRRLGQAEPAGDLAVGQPGADQPHGLHLTAGQHVRLGG